MPRKRTEPKRIAEQKLPLPPQPVIWAHSVRKQAKCVVCGSNAAPFSNEDLCWVCRRLKISAWRESEGMAATQE